MLTLCATDFFRGRNPVYRVTLLIFLLFQVGCALAPNIEALLLFRFFSGFFGSPTVTNSGGSLSDIWPQSERSVPLALFSAASFLGPVIAPIVGGFVVQYLPFQWIFWIVLILGGTAYTAMLLFLRETYAPKLLKDRTKSNDELPKNGNLLKQYSTTLKRPWLMLFTEPILFFLSLYMALVFGILYLDCKFYPACLGQKCGYLFSRVVEVTAYPIVFGQARGWSPGISGLSFLGIGTGMAIATAGSPLINRIYSHFVQRLGSPRPEARLPHLIVLSWFIPISLFWFAWTALPPVHWIVPISSGVLFGMGLVPLFLGITSYLIDCYGPYAASALAANAVFRSLFGAVFPLFAKAMYQRLGTPWASSMLGFLAAALAPLPWIFYHYGPKIRGASKFHLEMLKENNVSV